MPSRGALSLSSITSTPLPQLGHRFDDVSAGGGDVAENGEGVSHERDEAAAALIQE